jgi:hypothetical protein
VGWWIQYRVGGQNVQRSLETESEQLAKLKLKQIEGLHASGELGLPSRTPIQSFLEFFCEHLQQRRSKTSYRADISYLRSFFGPLCKALKTKSQIEVEKKAAKANEVVPIPASNMPVGRPENLGRGPTNPSRAYGGDVESCRCSAKRSCGRTSDFRSRFWVDGRLSTGGERERWTRYGGWRAWLFRTCYGYSTSFLAR